jgi:invasion protein IalB
MDIRTLVAASLVAAFAATLPLPAAAESAKSLGRSGDWEGFAYSDGGGKVCYAAASAGKVTGGDKGKTTTFLIVTHRSGGKSANEVSVSGAYGFKKDSDVDLQIGPKQFTLFTKGDRAWAKDAAADKAVVAALQKGNGAALHATPVKGSALTAEVSLKGFSDALAAIDKACGVKR